MTCPSPPRPAARSDARAPAGARASIALQIGANEGSVSGLPSMFASTITPASAGGAGTLELAQCAALRVLPGQRREPAQPRRMGGLRRGHVVVHDLRGPQAHVGRSPIAVGAREREDADVDAVLVHRSQSQVVVEHRRHRRHERRAVEMDGAQSAANLRDRVARPAVPLQKLEPRLGQAMRVDVDDGTRQRQPPFDHRATT